MLSQTIEYPISPNYCKKWTIVDAIREVIANARDEGSYTTSWDKGIGKVVDNGKGISRTYFVLGEGEPKTVDQIGQFREGLKMAGLVFAREGRSFKGKTLKYEFAFNLSDSITFGCRVLNIEFRALPINCVGTTIEFECTEEELDEAIDLFLPRDQATKNCILSESDKQGILYINGVKVQKVDALYGYNMIDKAAVNRDRTVLDMSKVKACIAKAWIAADMNHIKTLLTTKTAWLEHSVYFESCNSDTWNEVLTELYGPKRCIIDDKAHIARDRSWTVIEPVSWYLKWTLMNQLGTFNVKTATDVLTARENLDLTDITTQLPRDVRRTLQEAIKIAEMVIGVTLHVEVVQTLSLLDDRSVYSMYYTDENKIRIAKHTLDKEFSFVVGALIHEGIHQVSGTEDSSAKFECAMTELIGKTAILAHRVYLNRN